MSAACALNKAINFPLDSILRDTQYERDGINANAKVI